MTSEITDPNDDIYKAWPDIPFETWKDTCATLQLWLQIVGKYRLRRAPWINHGWHATFYVTARGLTTSLIPVGSLGVQFDFDFVDHKLIASVTNGSRSGIALEPMTVADFYARFLVLTDELHVRTEINRMPNEVPDAVPFDGDTAHASYDAEAVTRFWQALVQIDRVLKYFRTGFLGKVDVRCTCSGAAFDPGGHAVFRPPCAAAFGGRAGLARRCNARSLFARGQLGRLLAGRRAGRLSRLLFLRLPGA